MNTAIILAGGIGMRMGSLETPKQFIDIYGKPIIIHTIETFDTHPQIDRIIVVCLEDWIEKLNILIRQYDLNKVCRVVRGGNTRQESVYNGLKVIYDNHADTNEDIVLIHDSVRPLVSHRIISENIERAEIHGAVDTVINLDDTIINSLDRNKIDSVPDRNLFFLGQTPQSFKFKLLWEAHNYAKEIGKSNVTDDCQLVLDLGKDVFLAKGDKLNFKITSSEDLLLLRAISKLGNTEMMI